MNEHIVNTQVVVRIGKDPRLEEHAALLAVVAALDRCRASAPMAPLPIPSALDTSAPSPLLALPVIEAGLAGEDRFDLSRLRRVLDRRLEEHLHHLAQTVPDVEHVAAELHASIAGHADDRNPYTEANAWRQLSGLQHHAEQDNGDVADPAELLATAEASIQAAENRCASLDRRPAVSPRAIPHWFVPTGASVLLFGCAFALGLPAPAALCVCALAGTALWYWRRPGADTVAEPDPLNRMRKRLLAEPARLLALHYDARAASAAAAQRVRFASQLRGRLAGPRADERLAALEEEVRRRVATIPDSPFREIRFGCSWLGGREAATSVLRRSSIRMTWPAAVDLSNAEAACDRLVACAKSQIGPLSLTDAAGEGFDLLLRPRLQSLQVDARMPLALRPGLLLDRRLCPESWSIGVPPGCPELTSLVRGVFPSAALHDAFMPDTIEVVYVIRNLTHAHLQSHVRAASSYRASSAMEHQVSHYPRRLCAIQDRGVEPRE